MDDHFHVTGTLRCHFLENSQFIQYINNVYKSKWATLSASANKQHLWISQ